MRWTLLIPCLTGCFAYDGVKMGDDFDGRGLDTAAVGCEADGSPSLQLGSVDPVFKAWETDAPLVIHIGSEGGLSLPFAVASQGTPNQAQMTAVFTLNDGPVLAQATDVPIQLLCGPDGHLVSEPLRLTVSWEEDSFDLFALPATLETTLMFPTGLELSAAAASEITF